MAGQSKKREESVTPGQTVFYRLTYKNAAAVNKRREDSKDFMKLIREIPEDMSDEMTLLWSRLYESGYQWHYGDLVKGGELLPATVVRAYSVYEMGTKDPNGDNTEGWSRKAFSGIADLRVLLPGNDILWVPGARKEDTGTSHTGKGQGITLMPSFGKFTTAVPATLI